MSQDYYSMFTFLCIEGYWNRTLPAGLFGLQCNSFCHTSGYGHNNCLPKFSPPKNFEFLPCGAWCTP